MGSKKLTANTPNSSLSNASLVPGYQWVVIDKHYMGGRPAICGFRITVEMLLDDMAKGWSEMDMETEYDLPASAVREALRFAREFMMEHAADVAAG
jgi:uncharacterized protein (DUF433 family)